MLGSEAIRDGSFFVHSLARTAKLSDGPGRIEHMFDSRVVEGPPSEDSLRLLLQADVHALARPDQIAFVVGCERAIRLLQALQVDGMVAAAGLASAADEEGVAEVTDAEELDEAAEEVAVALAGSRRFQLGRIDTARFLAAELPLTIAAMREGTFGWHEARLMVASAELLPRNKRGRLEQHVVPRGAHDLARRLRRAVGRLDPAAAREKAERNRSDRRL